MGDVRTWITHEPIGADSVLPLVESAQHGAALLFLGIVRNHNEGQLVSGVNYEGYIEMAERVLRDIADEAFSKVQPARIAAVHRLGQLNVGDVSIAIAVSTPHRAEAYEASRYIIEEVKKRLSVWKEEQYLSGEAAWL